VVYRAGFARTRPQARQLVNHGHFRVNGSKVDIPSYQVRAGDVVTIKERSKDTFAVQQAIDTIDRSAPEWLDVDANTRTATVTVVPSREQIDTEIKEQLVVELYSK
jgi:small subunit ribosomal protein S4